MQIESETTWLAVILTVGTMLILFIFAQRARTREAKLQVAAAQMRYMLPRLSTFLTEGAGLDAKGGGGLDKERSFLLGLLDECPRCGEFFGEGTSKQDKRDHLACCADTAAIARKRRRDADDDAAAAKRDDADAAAEAAQAKAVWEAAGKQVSQLWMLPDAALADMCGGVAEGLSRAIDVIGGGRLTLRRVHIVNGVAETGGGLLVQGAGSSLLMLQASVRDCVAIGGIRDTDGGGELAQSPPPLPALPVPPTLTDHARCSAGPHAHRRALPDDGRERRPGGEHDRRLRDGPHRRRPLCHTPG